MLEFIAPTYLLISSMCFSGYSFLEMSKQKGKLDATDSSFLSSWFVCSFIITIMLYMATKNPQMAAKSPQGLIMLLLLICCTWCISCSSLYKRSR
jgi:CDP-diglyceride synthetase